MIVLPFRIPNRSDIESIFGNTTIFGGSVVTVDVTIAAIVKNKSFLVFNLMGTGGSTQPSQQLVRGRIKDSTTITFDRDSMYAAQTLFINWWVVEYKASSSVNVIHGTKTLASATDNTTITSVDLDHAFPIMTWQMSGTSWGVSEWLSVELTSSTNIQLKTAQLNGHIANYQVIENTDWEVSAYSGNITALQTSVNVTISAVTMAETLLMGSAVVVASPGLLDLQAVPRFAITSTTQITIARSVADKEFNFVFYVIETGGKVAAQRDLTESISNGNTSGVKTWSSFNTSLTILIFESLTNFLATNNSGITKQMQNMAVSLGINSSTQTSQTRTGTVQDVQVSHELWDFSNS